jgi:hypothetical protein
MIELKFIIPPLISFIVIVGQIFDGLPESVRLAIDLAAICTLAAGFLVLGRLRGALSASEAAAAAWKEERDAAVSKADRLHQELIIVRDTKEEESKLLREEISQLKIEITRLQERPTLEVLAMKLDALTEAIKTQTSVGTITTVTKTVEGVE